MAKSEAVGGITVSASWLQERLSQKGSAKVHILDCSWYLPQLNRNPRAEFAQRHIRGARFFDVDAVADCSNSLLPHMLPTVEHFAEAMDALGISAEDTIVFYDTTHVFCGAARMWWTAQVFGASKEKLHILEGTLDEIAKQHPSLVCSDNAEEKDSADEKSPQALTALWPRVYKSEWVVSMNELIQLSVSKSAQKNLQVIDTRSFARFMALAPEPRQVAHIGHIPGALNVDYLSVIRLRGDLTKEQLQQKRSPTDFSQTFVSVEQTRDLLCKQGIAVSELGHRTTIDLQRQIVVYCGSGITAAALLVALVRAGASSVRLYDGSWAQWGNAQATASLISRPCFVPLFLLAGERNDFIVEAKRVGCPPGTDKSKVFSWLYCSGGKCTQLHFASMSVRDDQQERTFADGSTLRWNSASRVGTFKQVGKDETGLKVLDPVSMPPDLVGTVDKWLNAVSISSL